MKRLLVAAMLVMFTLTGCNQAGKDAANASRIAMAVALKDVLVAVSNSPGPSDDLALGFLIGSGAFKVQDADGFVQYAHGAGMFARAFLPYADLIWGSAGYDGMIVESNGGDVLFHSNKVGNDFVKMYGNEGVSTQRDNYVTPID